MKGGVAISSSAAPWCATTGDCSPRIHQLPGEPQLSVVPFRHVPEGVRDLDEHNCEIVRRIQHGGEFWVAHARIDGRIYIRPCIVNYRTTDDDVLAFVEQVERIGRELAR